MKTSITLFTLALLFVSVFVHAEPSPKKASVMVVESAHPYHFVLKADKTMKNAEVNVYSASGDLVTTEKLSMHKMIIDFRDIRFGAYTIQVKKDGVTQEFNYEKKLVISDVIR